VLQGFLDVFVEDETGRRLTTRLGPWECIYCAAGVVHGFQQDFSKARSQGGMCGLHGYSLRHR
jgi:hypothetical protein